MDEERRVVWFEDVGKEDISLVGGKGANLGEMTRAHIPVPPGFIGTAQSYFYFLEKSNLSGEIRSLLSSLDPDDSGELQRVASKMKEAINGAFMPDLKLRMMVEVPSNIFLPSLWRRSWG